ncbi:hypothetical protein PV327_001276 [Microctonus hyperodae]|uniref:BRISC complex subunit FAM175B helical domain-containing protein n=1 Tax=Microctonus hyperodae TaxID=165561 RepID=A0AA39G8V7_MICHY|nr:hypothetical protein PV327_001276 [Microctonus hyperodae]
MADNELLVTISGAALSLLFYENVQRVGDQMGFLLGEVLTYVTKSVTDDDKQMESTKSHVDIQGILPSPSTGLFYDSGGKINLSVLAEFIGEKREEIVGWYRFRSNGSLNPTFRDKIIHRQLDGFFSDYHNNQTFVTCMLNYGTTKIGGTHKFRHVFLRYQNGFYVPISLRINNLGADASRHDGSDYKPTPTRHYNNGPNYFTKLLEPLKRNTHMSGVQMISMIHKIAEKHLDKLVPDVCKSDAEVAVLEQQFQRVREEIRHIHATNIKKVPSIDYYLPGEPHYSNKLMKGMNEQNNRLPMNDVSTSRFSKHCDTEYMAKDTGIAMNINDCYESNDKKKTSHTISYSDVTKIKSEHTTDC